VNLLGFIETEGDDLSPSFTDVCPGNCQISVEDILNALAPYRWLIYDRQPACKIATKQAGLVGYVLTKPERACKSQGNR
jgi:hypothetical protein